MSYATPSQTNITVVRQYRGLLEVVLFSAPVTVPCFVFLYINGIMLFILRSKSVFHETPRYILLYNLLFAETILMAIGQLLYLLSMCRIYLTYPVCGVIVMLTILTIEVSPLTLVVMSLERCVAVCYPLRHATIITIRNTELAILLVWVISSLNVLTRVLLLLDVPFDLESKPMEQFCAKENVLLGPMSNNFDKAYTYFLFISAGVTVISSYIGVVIAARSATADKASARKARNTLLLHLVQLILSLLSTIHKPLHIALSKVIVKIALERIQIFLYVFIVIFPRCLSALIYGIRDQTIRPLLVYYLCCAMKLPLILTKAEVSPKDT